MRNKGITLISLIITIIILLILASTATYTGFETVKNARLNAFVAKLQLIQQTVNTVYEKKEFEGFNSNSIFDIPSSLQEEVNTAYQSANNEIGIEAELSEFRYFDEENLSKYLKLDDIELDVIICFETREVISVDGIEYDDVIHYVQENLPGGIKNINHENTVEPGFEIEKLNYGLSATIKITNVVSDNSRVMYREVGDYTGKDSNGNKLYEEKQNSYWEEMTNGQVVIKKTGNYEFKVTNEDEEYKKVVNVTLVNEPKVVDGMIPVKWNGTNWVVTSKSSGDWYNYEAQTEDEGTSKWANVMLSDGKYKYDTVEKGQVIQESELGSMFVWIPRYMYKIDTLKDSNGLLISGTGYQTSGGGTINIKFLNGTTDIPTDNTNDTIKNEGGNGNWNVHPCFTNGKSNQFKNGEWDEEITGIWVAKYDAGFQASTTNSSDATTVINSSDTIVYSDKNYTSYNTSAAKNAISQDLTDNPMMSYPVFKPLTYAYNNISSGDSYIISQEIAKSDFYGLNSTQIDSHMMKNSEWGAVAYLTHSAYGRNGNEITINSKNLNNLNYNYIYSVTGYEENTPNGVGASSTNNMTGIFDLSGGVQNRTTGYVTTGTATVTKYASSYAYGERDTEGYKTRSTKYATVYPFDSTSSTSSNNWIKYNSLKGKKYGYGDAVLEVTQSGTGTNAWNNEKFEFLGVHFSRGGMYTTGSMYTSIVTDGGSYSGSGFRTILIGI